MSARSRIFAVLLTLFALLGVQPGLIAPAQAQVQTQAQPQTQSPKQSQTGARVVAEEQIGPRLVDLTVESPALGTTVKVRLMTPDGWEKRRTGQRWPVLYLLHGCCGDYTSWTALTKVEEFPELRNVLVVMPEAGNAGFYSDWLEGPGWETFHLRELRSILERSYGAGHRRVVAGLSMGGFGALSYAGRHPELFRAAASYSGVVDTRYVQGASDLVLSIVGWYSPDPLALWGSPTESARIWAAHNPVDLARRLSRIPVYLSCGDGTTGPLDPPGSTSDLEKLLLAENELLAARLRSTGARHLTLSFYGGGTHTWPYWERELKRSLPMLLGA